MVNNDEFSKLQNDVEKLEKRIRQLEFQLEAKHYESRTPKPVKPRKPAKSRQVDLPDAEKEAAHINKKSKPTTNDKDWETQLGQVWLPRVFIVVLVFGFIFLFKLGIDSGWMTPIVRVITGVVTSCLLFWIGNMQMMKSRRTLGLVLLGGSVGVLTLTIFAARVLYGMIPVSAAFIFYLLTVTYGLWLSLKKKSQYLSIFSGVVGCFVPFLLDSTSGDIIVFGAYEFILYTSLLILAYKYNYTVLFFVSNIMLQVSYGLYAAFTAIIFNNYIDIEWLATLVLLQHGIMYSLILFARSLKKTVGRTAVSSLILSLLWIYTAFDEMTIHIILIGMTIVYITGYVLFRDKSATNKAISLPLAVLTSAIYIYDVLLSNHYEIWLLVQGTIVMWLACRLKNAGMKLTGFLVYLFAFLHIVDNRIHDVISVESLFWIVALGTLVSLYYLDGLIPEKERKNITAAIFNIGLWLMLTQWVITLTMERGFDIQQLSLTLFWGIYAIVYVIIGQWRNLQKVRLVGMVLIFLTLAKLVLYDLNELSLAIRTVLFIFIGSIGLLMSYTFYTKNKKNEKED